MWGATCSAPKWRPVSAISIHAPRVGSDRGVTATLPFSIDFNPRSPCGERRGQLCAGAAGCDFNPRSPCGERPLSGRKAVYGDDFNPRSPCGERHAAVGYCCKYIGFQSTLPVWGATRICVSLTCPEPISIHAPRVGSDFIPPPHRGGIFYFNPRSPCGERLYGATAFLCHPKFQSTLPVWGATFVARPDASSQEFQSTLPVWERPP